MSLSRLLKNIVRDSLMQAYRSQEIRDIVTDLIYPNPLLKKTFRSAVKTLNSRYHFKSSQVLKMSEESIENSDMAKGALCPEAYITYSHLKAISNNLPSKKLS